jgi:hypothetical protein
MSRNDNKNDWMCKKCDFLIYGKKPFCNKCGSVKPNLNPTPKVDPNETVKTYEQFKIELYAMTKEY